MPDHEGGRRDAVDGATGSEDERGGGDDDGAGDVQQARGGQHACGDRPDARRDQDAAGQAAGEHAVRPSGGVCGPSPGLCGMRGAAAPQGPAHASAADVVRHGRGRGAAVQGVPLPFDDASGGGDGLADLRAVDRPLHAGAGAGAGRVGRAHLVPGWCAHSGSSAARLAGEP